jgi:hypothetical protein
VTKSAWPGILAPFACRRAPLKATIKTRRWRALGALVPYAGEEVAIVMSGGDCDYFDSAGRHEFFLVGSKTAEVF